MLNTPTVLAVTVAPMREVLPAYGLDFDVLARAAGVDPDLVSRPNTRCSSVRVQRLWQLAAEASHDPQFGLKVGRAMPPGTFHALGLGIVSSTSVLKALKRVERYSHVVSTNGRFVLVDHGPTVSLESRSTEASFRPSPHAIDALTVALCRMLTLCAGPSATPVRVQLPYRSDAPPEALRDAMNCPVEGDAPHLALEFDAVAASKPVLTGNPDLAAEADRLAARYLQSVTPESTAARVRQLLLKAMPSGELDQQQVARTLNQSASTLQRRLREEGTSFQDVLDATRRDLSLDYLQAGTHSLADIAFLLGFSDQSNFTRAFRRWTGKTPKQYLP
jgi:AraC-like DNA-binding protein